MNQEIHPYSTMNNGSVKIKTSPGDNKRMKLFIRCRDIFAQIDVNSDGTLTEEEFIKGTILNQHLCHYFISPQTLHFGVTTSSSYAMALVLYADLLLNIASRLPAGRRVDIAVDKAL